MRAGGANPDLPPCPLVCLKGGLPKWAWINGRSKNGVSMVFRVRRLFSIYVAYHLPVSDTAQVGRAARLRLLPGFALAGMRALPAALRWVRHRDPAARARVKQLLDLSGPAPVALDPALFAPKQTLNVPEGAAVTVVMPVYDNLDMTCEALRRLEAHTDIPWRLVLIDDASPAPQVRPCLQGWAAARGDRVTLIENDENLGFVGAVNRGLKQALNWPDPVVLLNTDAYLPKGWAPRLLRPIWQDEGVASVTPLSNDAELGSVPLPGRARDIRVETAERIDVLAGALNGAAAQVPGPAGVGFCMALAPRFLRALPQFDEAFAPGYGEEVDWCRKALAQGGRHIYVPDLFVAHMGGQSFGSARKRALIARNSEILTRRYPGFDAEVHGFLRRDPLVTARLALGMAWAEAQRGDRALPIYLGHSMGGGADIDLLRRIRADMEHVGAAIVIRVGGVFRFTLELWMKDDEAPLAGGCADWDLLMQLLVPVARRRLVYSNAVGDCDPLAIPGLFQSLFRPESDELQVLIHDYFPISPAPTLLGAGDLYRGLPDSEGGDARHTTRRPDGSAVSLAVWQQAWGGLLARADRVECFSQASARLVQGAYPKLENIAVCPHVLHSAVPRIPPPKTTQPVIGILGNLAPHKGAGVAQDLSRHLAKHANGGQDVGLVLLGDLDPAYSLSAPACLHGRYSVDALPDLVARYGITCWLVPSVWPETFSFTTHEALATGLPVIAFDLGAQGDAVRAAMAQGAPGALLPLAQGHPPVSGRIIEEAVRLSAVAEQGS